METRNCIKCGKLFLYISSNICIECRDKEEKIFNKVKKYLEENPSKNLTEISLETGVSKNKILQYIQDGRLISTEGMIGQVICHKCGDFIKQGRYCDKCVVEIRGKFEKVISKEDTEVKHKYTKVHFMNRKK